MNLITDTWLTLSRNGSQDLILARPAEILESVTTRPFRFVYSPRPDFRVNMLQFLIGLVQTALPPEDEDEWLEKFLAPPNITELEDALRPLINYFNLCGDGPLFMQETGLKDGSTVPIATLLIDGPGANAEKNNTDFFVKRGKKERLCSACTAIGLFTLQNNAPTGGAGHRTSLRGGGPLSTIILPHQIQPEFNTLWHCIWLNVLNTEDLAKTGAETKKPNSDLFPWTVPVKHSQQPGTEITAEEIHPCHTYWAMPRRILLSKPIEEGGECNICARKSEIFYRSYITKNYGNNYGAGIIHPLSPYYSDKAGLKLPVHPQPGGFTYRHWPTYIMGNDSQKPRALNLSAMSNRLPMLQDHSTHISALACGYDMDNMKARCWYESQLPIWFLQEVVASHVRTRAQQLATTAQNVAVNTRQAVKRTWFDKGATVRGDLDFVEQQLWEFTEDDFYSKLWVIKELVEDNDPDSQIVAINELLRDWLTILNRSSLQIFDSYAEQIPLDACNMDGTPRRITERSKLTHFNLGKKNRTELGLPEVKGAKHA